MPKKTYVVNDAELKLLKLIKDKALNNKLVLNDSFIVRLGIHLVSELSNAKIEKAVREFPKPLMGRRPSK